MRVALRRRRAGAVAVGAALMVCGVLGPLAAPAFADDGIAPASPAASSPSPSPASGADGFAITSPSSAQVTGPAGTVLGITVRCPTGTGCPSDATTQAPVYLDDPRGSSETCHTIGPVPMQVGTATMTGSFDTSRAYPSGCGGLSGLPAYNGAWTVRIGGNYPDARPVTLRIAPAQPLAPTVSTTASGLHISWSPTPEPDTDSYLVAVDGNASKISCAAGSSGCSTDVAAPRATHTVAVSALRHPAPGDSSYLEPGPASPSVTSAPAPASPSSPAPSSHGASSSTAGHPTGRSTGSSGLSGTLLGQHGLTGSFNQFAQPLGTGGLPTLPKVKATASAAPSQLAGEGNTEPDGPYGKTLGYGTQSQDYYTTSQHATASSDPISQALGVSQQTFWGSVAGALLLLLAAVHLRLWATRETPF